MLSRTLGILKTLLVPSTLPRRQSLPEAGQDVKREAPPSPAETGPPQYLSQSLTLETIPVHVFRLIADQVRLSGGSLRNISLTSHKLRALVSPVLFAICTVHTRTQYDPPIAVRPFVRHMIHSGPLDVAEDSQHFEKLLARLPAVFHVTFGSADSGIPWSVLLICLKTSRVKSITYEADAGFIRMHELPPAESASVPTTLKTFEYVASDWRGFQKFHPQHKTIEKAFAFEGWCLAAIVPRMNATVTHLALPMQSAPLVAMASLEWPQLKHLSLRGQFAYPSRAAQEMSALRRLLLSLPSLRTLEVEITRDGYLGQTPLFPSPSLKTAPKRHPTPSSFLRELQSLRVAYPDPDDGLFSMDFANLTQLSLTDYPRYYHYFGRAARFGLAPTPQQIARVQSSGACLRILRRMKLPNLTRLEVVYMASRAGSDDDLLHHVAHSYPRLSFLELHRYREDEKEEVHYTHIAEQLSAARSLEVVHLNLNFYDDHGAYCNDQDERDAWAITLREQRGAEIVKAMVVCPRLEYVGLLYHGDPHPVWVEFHPSRCTEPRYVLRYDIQHRDSVPLPVDWMRPS